MERLKDFMSKNKIAVAIISTVVVAVIVATVVVVATTPKKMLTLQKDVFTVEYGESVSTEVKTYLNKDTEKEVLKDSKLSIKKLENEEEKEYPAVGEYKGTITYKEEKVSFTVEVKDTTAPEFVDLPKSISVEKDAQDVDYTKYFKATDLNEVKITVNSKKVDLSKEGEYTLTVTATDIYKNAIKEKVKVNIVSKEKAKAGEVTKYVDSDSAPQSAALVEEIQKEKEEAEKKAQEEAAAQQAQQGTSGGTSAGTSGGTSSGTTSGGTTAAQPYYRTDISNTLVAQINAYRQQNGVATIPVSSEAQAEANMRAMQLINSFSHNSSVGFMENIGQGGINADFFTAWKNSPGHNTTMLRDDVFNGVHTYQSFAVSVVEYKGMWYAVTSFKTNNY